MDLLPQINLSQDLDSATPISGPDRPKSNGSEIDMDKIYESIERGLEELDSPIRPTRFGNDVLMPDSIIPGNAVSPRWRRIKRSNSILKEYIHPKDYERVSMRANEKERRRRDRETQEWKEYSKKSTSSLHAVIDKKSGSAKIPVQESLDAVISSLKLFTSSSINAFHSQVNPQEIAGIGKDL